MMLHCNNAEKHGNLCLGYGIGDSDEPCEICKNCIKCESGYYQLGETEKDDQLTKAKELLKEFIFLLHNPRTALDTKTVMDEAEQFLSEVEK